MMAMKKKFLFPALLLALLLTGCGSPKDVPEEPTVPPETAIETTLPPAEGFNTLGGTWEVGGFYYKGQIVDIHNNEALEHLYDTHLLIFHPDGTFLYMPSIFFSEGEYKSYDSAAGQESYLLNTQRVYRLSYEDGEVTEKDSTDTTKTKYLVTILDENTLKLSPFDPITGRAKSDTDPLIFSRSHEESGYIADNKTPLSQPKEPTNQKPVTKKADGYEGILEEYTRKMEQAAPGLVREYNSEASGISDINRLAEICNAKVGKLAEINNEGVGEMAELMYRRGDDYSVYESWAGQLMDNYAKIAQDIQDAYLDSAVSSMGY